jgi:ATP-dependent protease ClpP protease subunit
MLPLLLPLLLTSTFTRRMVTLGLAMPSLPLVARPALATSRLELYGEIDAEAGHRLEHAPLKVDERLRDTGHPICLHNQSFGGDVMTTLHLLDCIDGLACPVWTYVEGYAASAASALATLLYDIYMRRSHLTPRDLTQLLPIDRWLNASTCVALGLVDAVR